MSPDQLRKRLKQRGITHKDIAKATVSPRSPNGVHRSMVSKVLAGKVSSQYVLDAALRLLNG